MDALWLAEVGIAERKTKRWGYVDRSGAWVIEPQFESAAPFAEGLAIVETYGDQYGFVDATGALRIPAVYAQVNGHFEGGVVPVKLGRKWGVIDRDGNEVIAPTYQWVSAFSEGLAAVEVTGGNHGYIDTTGAWVIEPHGIDSPGRFSGGLARVTVDGKTRYIKRDGTFAFAATFDDGRDFVDGLAVVLRNGHAGCIDSTGAFVIEPRFGFIDVFVDGVALAAEREARLPAGLSKFTYHGTRWGFIDHRGTFIVEPRFTRALELSEGLAMVRDGETCGYIDRHGAFVIAPRFKRAKSFHGGLASVAEDDKLYGYVDRKGSMVVAPRFWRAGDFSKVERLEPPIATKGPAKKRAPRPSDEPEPIGTIASINASLRTVIADATVAAAWLGIDGRSDASEDWPKTKAKTKAKTKTTAAVRKPKKEDVEDDSSRAFYAARNKDAAAIAIGNGEGVALDLGMGNGIAHVFQPEPGRLVLVEGFISDADPGFTVWATTSPTRAARTKASFAIKSGVVALLESCDSGAPIPSLLPKKAAAGFTRKFESSLLVAVPNGTFDVVVEPEHQADWGSARRCHLVRR